MQKILFISISLFFLLTSCNQEERGEIIWVVNSLTEGNTSGQLSYISGEELENQEWVPFEGELIDYSVEEGSIQKLEVQLDEETNTYRVLKSIEKKEDSRLTLNGGWIAFEIFEKKIDSSIVAPTLTVDIYQNIVYGSGGCNRFTAPIINLSYNSITLGNAGATLKACIEENVEETFLNAFFQLSEYQTQEGVLVFFDAEGQEIMKLKRDDMAKYRSALQGEWKAIKISGNEIVGGLPILQFDFDEMRVLFLGLMDVIIILAQWRKFQKLFFILEC